MEIKTLNVEENLDLHLLRIAQASGSAAAKDVYIKFVTKRQSSRSNRTLTSQQVVLA